MTDEELRHLIRQLRIGALTINEADELGDHIESERARVRDVCDWIEDLSYTIYGQGGRIGSDSPKCFEVNAVLALVKELRQ